MGFYVEVCHFQNLVCKATALFLLWYALFYANIILFYEVLRPN